MTTLLGAGFAIGFLGSLHCVGMCGGLVSALSMSRPRLWWPGLLAYQGGRIASYTALGLLAGLIGAGLTASPWLQGAQLLLGVVAGMLMIVFALYLGGWLPDPFAKLTRGISQATGLSRWLQLAASSPHAGPWLAVGLLNGLLPCGLVYAALALSLTAASALEGALVMLAFGLGTLPAMTAVPALLRTLTPQRRGLVLKIGAALLIALGVLTIARGVLHGDHAGHEPASGSAHQPHAH